MAQLDDAVAALLSVDLAGVELHNKRILYRVDLNVPVCQGKVVDDTRLRSILPTLQLLLQKGARVVLCSHWGRPDPTLSKDLLRNFSLAPVAQLLEQQLGPDVFTGLTADCVGSAAQTAVQQLQPGQVTSAASVFFSLCSN
jgi:phosphoglycerate kinase